MKTLTLITLTLLLFACEKNESPKSFCGSIYKTTWHVQDEPEKTVYCEIEGYYTIAIDVDEKPFYNFEVKGNSIKLIATDEIRNKEKVEVEIRVVFENVQGGFMPVLQKELIINFSKN